MKSFIFKIVFYSTKPFMRILASFLRNFGEFFITHTQNVRKNRRRVIHLCSNTSYRINNDKDIKFRFVIVVFTRILNVYLKQILQFCFRQIATVFLLMIAIILPLLSFISNQANGKFNKIAPGSKLLFVANFIFGKEVSEGVFAQIVGDWRADYFNAVSQNRILKAKWISVCGCRDFIAAFIKQSFIGEIVESIKKVIS